MSPDGEMLQAPHTLVCRGSRHCVFPPQMLRQHAGLLEETGNYCLIKISYRSSLVSSSLLGPSPAVPLHAPAPPRREALQKGLEQSESSHLRHRGAVINGRRSEPLHTAALPPPLAAIVPPPVRLSICFIVLPVCEASYSNPYAVAVNQGTHGSWGQGNRGDFCGQGSQFMLFQNV